MGIRVLLDTHALVWALSQPRRLSDSAAQVIENTQSSLYISSVSIFEIANKYRLGKWPEVQRIIDNLGCLDALGCVRLPVNEAHALAAGLLPYVHRDPFDRLLIAQAISEALPVVTLDPAIRKAPGVVTIW